MTARLTRLSVEGREHPLGVDESRPRFGWILDPDRHDVEVGAARVSVRGPAGDVVAEASGRADELRVSLDTAAKWRSLTSYRWRLEVDSVVDGSAVTLSAESAFETGVLEESEWRGAAWIAGAEASDTRPAPLLRAEFEVPDGLDRARLVVAVGGIAAITLNGRVPDEERLSVGLTDFDERVPYVVHDVTSMLAPGRCTLAIGLGRGFYGMTTENTWTWHTAPWHDEPCVRALLLLEHGEGETVIATGPGFRTARGGTRADSYYEGEVFDARLEPEGWRTTGFDDADWSAAAVVPGPKGVLRARPFPPVRIVDTLRPASVAPLGPGRFAIDFGRQIAGWLRVALPAAPSGTEVTLRAAERLIDGIPTIDTPFSAGELQLDRLVSAGPPLTWEPAFGYKGFQYVDVTGWPDEDPGSALSACVAHSDVARTGRFSSSDDRLTWMHEAAVATLLNNLHHIPTDTPVFEKNGWTGDAALGASMLLRDLDTVGLLEDWVDSVAESRDADGRPALIAPSPNWVWPEHMEAPPWHAVYWTIPWRIYEATGDHRALLRHADGIHRYLRLERSALVDGLARTGLGDYLSPDKSGNPDEDLRVCATVALHDGARVGARIAALQGDTAAEREFLELASGLRAAFRRTFVDAAAGIVRDEVAGYRQTHNVLALDAGMLDAAEIPRAVARLARDVDEHRGGHLWVGALGVRRALPVLAEHGHARTAFRAATAPDFPGWLAWRAAGASTMWEYWDDQRSRNHYFLGTVDDWLFEHVAGLTLTAPGYRAVRIRPDHLADVSDARVELETVRGAIALEWEHDGKVGVLRTSLPHGSRGVVELPGAPTVTTTGDGEFRFTLPERRA